jgi:hypothetical protein
MLLLVTSAAVTIYIVQTERQSSTADIRLKFSVNALTSSCVYVNYDGYYKIIGKGAVD